MNQEHSASFRKLKDSLEKLVKHYRVLLDQLRREKDLLTENAAEELVTLNSEKEVLLGKISQTENLRKRQTMELASALKVSEQNPRLMELASLLPDAEAEKLRTIHSTLDLLLKRVVEINTVNSRLATSALKNANGALANIKRALGQSKPTYERKGRMHQGEDESGHFVKREV